jgi:hypothetical protein
MAPPDDCVKVKEVKIESGFHPWLLEGGWGNSAIMRKREITTRLLTVDAASAVVARPVRSEPRLGSEQ